MVDNLLKSMPATDVQFEVAATKQKFVLMLRQNPSSFVSAVPVFCTYPRVDEEGVRSTA